MIELRGKIALVTGAARRIGREVALALAEAGVDVFLTYRRSEEAAKRTVTDLRDLGVRVGAASVDLTRLDDCDSLIDRHLADFGPVDILVNNASEFVFSPLSDLEKDRERFESLFDSMTAVHMRAPLYLGLRLGLSMKSRGWGRIVNLTDRAVAKSQAYPNHAVYLASKYGLLGVTQCLALELAPEVTVNSVAPGIALVPGDYPPEKTRRLVAKVPLGRQSGPREIAADVVALVRSEFKTGTMIVSDGGETLGL